MKNPRRLALLKRNTALGGWGKPTIRARGSQESGGTGRMWCAPVLVALVKSHAWKATCIAINAHFYCEVKWQLPNVNFTGCLRSRRAYLINGALFYLREMVFSSLAPRQTAECQRRCCQRQNGSGCLREKGKLGNTTIIAGPGPQKTDCVVSQRAKRSMEPGSV